MNKNVLLDLEGNKFGSLHDKDSTTTLRGRHPLKSKPVLIRDSLITLQCILLNICTTVALVSMNKIIFTDSQLRNCQMLVAAWHFLVTTAALYLATLIGIFPAVRVPVLKMLSIACFFAAFLTLGNLSLTYNSLGFYQVAKVMTTPTVVMFNFLIFGITITRRSLLAVGAVCAGVLLVSCTALADNSMGMLTAVAAFTVTALYQVWIGKRMSDLQISGPQLLLNQAPIATVLLLLLATIIDTVPDSAAIPKRTNWILICSGFLASLLNLSQFLIIERSSALAFNIISQVKTVIIVSLSWYNEGRKVTKIEAFGVALTVGGAYAYSVFAVRSSAAR